VLSYQSYYVVPMALWQVGAEILIMFEAKGVAKDE
jgi:hypothetical protein